MGQDTSTRKDLWGQPLPPKSEYSGAKYCGSRPCDIKLRHNYRKRLHASADCCGTCKHHGAKSLHGTRYHKCDLIGNSNGPATDVRVSYVCDKFETEIPL
jgi:hypothetical protein